MGELHKLLEELPGYKIADSHFRIGSKIHISCFYYAKRFFQNSFFASRFAYLLANEIIRDFTPGDPPNKTEIESLTGFVPLSQLRQEGLTLVGYGIYSELLLSLTEKFLISYGGFAEDRINHNIMEDVQDLNYVKDRMPHRHVILVVPIASTFSTSIKMEKEIKRKPKANTGINVLGIHYNLLHVFSTPLAAAPTKIEREFGWTEKFWEKRQIHMDAFYDTEQPSNRIQKYFLQLPSQWQEIKECTDCSCEEDGVELLLEEKPLFETDRTEVTPAMIFKIPQGTRFEPVMKQSNFTLLPSMIGYGHQLRNSSHFLYTVDTEAFLSINETAVKNWLRNLKKHTDINSGLSDLDNVLIVSSCHYSNTAFINLVNQVLYGSAANIIHYNPSHDYIQNFDMIYGQEVYMADKIVFVDDSLKTGKTFEKISQFIRHTIHLRSKGEKVQGMGRIHSCILLLNKSQPYTFEGIQNSLVHPHHIFAFANLHLFTSLSHDEESPLQLEERKYKQLYELAMLDSLRTHFAYQREKLRPRLPVRGNEISDERHLKMLEVTHRLYDYLAKIKQLDTEISFDNFAADLLSNSEFLNNYSTTKNLDTGIPVFKACLLKVMTQSPFTQYEPLKKLVFKWVLRLLLDHVKKVSDAIKEGKFSYPLFHDLKFYLRRACLLNSNVLLSRKIFSLIREMYGPKGLRTVIYAVTQWSVPVPETRQDPGLLSEAEKKSMREEQEALEKKRNTALKSISNFQLFFCAQIKELLWLNEARSIRLETLIERENTSNEQGFKRLMTMLRVENAVIIQQFCEFLEKLNAWQRLRVSGKSDQLEQADKLLIQKFLQKQQIQNHHSYKTLTSYFQVTNQGEKPCENDAFLLFLCARKYVEHEQEAKASARKLEEKTRYLFEAMYRIVKFTDLSNTAINNIGAFLIIKDTQGQPHIVYDYSMTKFSKLDKNNWNNEEDKLLARMLGLKDNSQEPLMAEEQMAAGIPGGIPESVDEETLSQEPTDYFEQETIIELNREEGKWINGHAEQYAERYVPLSDSFLDENVNRLILLRLSDRDSLTDKTKGLAGFYFHSSKKDPSDLIRLQYLLLLQPTITEFIEHNHRNNLFHEWLMSENKKRIMLLTGHSRETLQQLATDRPEFIQHAKQLDYLQAVILLNDNIGNVGGQKELKNKVNQIIDLDEKFKLTRAYMNDLKAMAEYLFDTKIIENSEPVKVIIVDKPDFSFTTNRMLIDLIFFELFINAKKNRWHFIQGDNSIPEDMNQIVISMEVIHQEGKNKLEVSLSNTGPNAKKSADVTKSIRNPAFTPKPDYITSGTAMIKTLLKEIFNGDIQLNSVPISGEDAPHWFIVTFFITEM